MIFEHRQTLKKSIVKEIFYFFCFYTNVRLFCNMVNYGSR